MFERLRQRQPGAGNGDQMYVVRHEAVSQQRKTVNFGILPQQVEISEAVGVAAQNHLPGVSTLRNMMGNVDDYDARQTSHFMKASEMTQLTDNTPVVFGALSHIGKKTGVRPVCPQVSPVRKKPRKRRRH